jgi:hypothetical protein
LKFLWLTNNWDIKYTILRDRDNKTDAILKEEFKKSLEDKDLKPNFITELLKKFKILDRYSIENFFLEEEKIVKINSTYSEINFKIDLLDFIKNKNKDLEKKQPEIFNDIDNLINKDFENLKFKIRWHNIFNALIFHLKIKWDIYFEEYINNSTIDDFWILKEYLDELFI